MTNPVPTKKPKNFDTVFQDFMLICCSCGSENVSLYVVTEEDPPRTSIEAHCIFCDAKDTSLQ